jgi:hypothetical protein
MSAGWYSGPITPSVDGAVFAFASAPQGPLVAVATANSEEAASGAEPFAITSLGLGSGWGIADVFALHVARFSEAPPERGKQMWD